MRSAGADIFAGMGWLDAERARGWLRVLAATTWAAAALWVLLSKNGLDSAGHVIGTDFVSFWSASRLLATGAAPETPYDHQVLAAFQTAAFNGADIAFAPFAYPPIFFLVCLPFGVLPYFAALSAWLAATAAGYVLVLRRWLSATPERWLLLAAYPGVLVNAGYGQNGFLTTALFGAGALMLRRNPLAAGACLGGLIFKPQLGVLIPIALLAARSWRAFTAAAAIAGGLVAISALLFGLEPWRGFFESAPFMSAVVTSGLLEPGKVQSAFAAAKLLGVDNGSALAIQGLWSVCAAASLFAIGRRIGPGPAFGACLISATLIATPYLLSYDLMLAAVPLAWLFDQGRRTGFLRWEKLVLLAGFTLPFLALALGVGLGVPVAPIVLTALYAATARRALLATDALGGHATPAEAQVAASQP